LRVSPVCPDAEAKPQQIPKLQVQLSSGDQHWFSVYELKPVAPKMLVESINNGNLVQPDQQRQLDFVALNSGRSAITPFFVRMYALGEGVTIQNDSVTFPSLEAGAREWCNGAPLSVTGSALAIPGTICPMMLIFNADNGFVDTAYFDLQIGEPRENTPQTPDGYGYICYDNSDQGWINAPTYEWIEICATDEASDFEGTRLAFNQRSQFDQGEAMVLPLPFRTKFYGEWVDSVTVGTNGYLLPGNQSRVINPQNWPLDRGIGGGVGMIAPFWDWLRFANNSNIYYYADRETGRFIVEWYRMRHHYADDNDLTFQVILYDQSRWARESGDPDVLFQYKQIENISGGAVGDTTEQEDIFYASVGISSPNGTTGSSYTFKNTYPVTSAELADRTAIRYTTSSLRHEGVAYGRVVETGFDQPVVNAYVFTTYGLTCRTDNNGYYRLPGIVNGGFSLTAWGETFADSTLHGFDLSNDDSVEVNFTLVHGSAAPEDGHHQPERFAIESVSPNPFNGTTTIHFTLDQPSLIRLTAYDLSGRAVSTIYAGMETPGAHVKEWNASELATGLYLIKLESADGQVEVAKALLTR